MSAIFRQARRKIQQKNRRAQTEAWPNACGPQNTPENNRARAVLPPGQTAANGGLSGNGGLPLSKRNLEVGQRLPCAPVVFDRNAKIV
jgi:hypothetical protein